jgi:hypothetical protein
MAHATTMQGNPCPSPADLLRRTDLGQSLLSGQRSPHVTSLSSTHGELANQSRVAILARTAADAMPAPVAVKRPIGVPVVTAHVTNGDARTGADAVPPPMAVKGPITIPPVAARRTSGDHYPSAAEKKSPLAASIVAASPMTNMTAQDLWPNGPDLWSAPTEKVGLKIKSSAELWPVDWTANLFGRPVMANAGVRPALAALTDGGEPVRPPPPSPSPPPLPPSDSLGEHGWESVSVSAATRTPTAAVRIDVLLPPGDAGIQAAARRVTEAITTSARNNPNHASVHVNMCLQRTASLNPQVSLPTRTVAAGICVVRCELVAN